MTDSSASGHAPFDPGTHIADQHETIHVRGARVNNLKNVDVDVPKRRLSVFTGVSGSGKSSLVFGTIAAESRRLIDETYSTFIQGFMPSLPRPDVDVLENLSPAIIIDQERMGANSRSTVGTATDAYSMLRLLFSRLSEPHVGTSGAFSFNLPEGWCPTCEGSGNAATLDQGAFLDESKSLNEGAIDAPNHKVGEWYWKTYGESDRLDPDRKICDYTADEREWFLHQPQTKVKVGTSNVSYEGLIPRIRRLWIDRPDPPKAKQIITFVERISTVSTCPDCQGARLNEAARTATVTSGASTLTIGACSQLQVDELLNFVQGLDRAAIGPVLDSLTDLLSSMVDVGLGYLSLDRPAGTLSGGEAQRVKMVRHLGSSLSDVTYVFDEPTTGLHPHDIHRMNALLANIRDKGNTVLVVEHNPEVIRTADYIVDLGPGSGTEGGEVVFTGTVEELLASSGSDTTATAHSLQQGLNLRAGGVAPRKPQGFIEVTGITRNNVVDQSVRFPRGTLTVVTGVAGSGKSTIVTEALHDREDVLVVDQSAIKGSRRSNPATYTGVMDKIRQLFAKKNKDAGATAAMFSFNSDGACPTCNGQGVVYVDLSFTAGVSSPCEECGGKRYRPEVLEYTIPGAKDVEGGRDLTIADVLGLSVAQAAKVLTTGEPKKILQRLLDVGLPYLTLGQPLNTLSGGERQRLKLAAQMDDGADIIVLDEPTAGLHVADTSVLVDMMHTLVDAGKSLVVVEHNLAVMAEADWIIDIGPGAGSKGGTIVFEGTPEELVAKADTVTGEYLAAALG